MKRLLSLLLTAALCLVSVCTAFARPEADWEPLCTPDEVDLSGVTEENGRLAGEIVLPDGILEGKLMIDCPVPTGFTAEQSQTLSVKYKKISKKELTAAMKVIGQAAKGGTMEYYNSNPETYIMFTRGAEVPEAYYWGNLDDASLCADERYQAQYDQAKTVLSSLITQLGGTICDNLTHTVRLDEEHCDPYSATASSYAPTQRERAVENFTDVMGDTERNITMVDSLYELYDLPVMYQFYYQYGGDTIGAESSIKGMVLDSGELKTVEIKGMPVVTGSEPLTLPDRDWQTLLATIIANNWCHAGAHSEDRVYDDPDLGITVTTYASYALITGIHPCWVGRTKSTLIPGWYMTVNERVCSDDSLVYPGDCYGDAETLTCIQG